MVNFQVGDPYDLTGHAGRITVLRGKVVEKSNCVLVDASAIATASPIEIAENGTYRVTYLYGSAKLDGRDWNQWELSSGLAGKMYILNLGNELSGFSVDGHATIELTETFQMGSYIDIALSAGTVYLFYYKEGGSGPITSYGSVIYHLEKIA
jgi:hypothetical protein